MLTETANVNLSERYETRPPAEAAASYGEDTIKLIQWANEPGASPNIANMVRLQARCAFRFAARALEAR